MPNVPIRSAEHGGDFIMHIPEDEIFPAETIHFKKPTEKEWKAYIEALVEKFGVDELKTLVKQYEGQKKWIKNVELALEKIKSDEEKKS